MGSTFDNTDDNEGIYGNQDGFATVINDMQQLSDAEKPRFNLRNMNGSDAAYATWVKDQTPENMSGLLSALAPTINSEIMRYAGPKNLLRSRAKVLAVKAVRTFNPMSGTKLNSWVITNLKPLARYSIQQRDVHIPEVAARQAAAVDSAVKSLTDELGREPTDAELADELGISENRVKAVRQKAIASVNSGRFDETGDDDFSGTPGVMETNKVPFAVEAVYRDLPETDRFIFDSATGMHGVQKLPATEVARRLGVSPAAVSQKAKMISSQIAYVVNNG